MEVLRNVQGIEPLYKRKGLVINEYHMVTNTSYIALVPKLGYIYPYG